MRLIGFDPGLQTTGWGVIQFKGNHLSYIGDGVVSTESSYSLAERLVQIYTGLSEIILKFEPDEAAVEETFVNVNPISTLKLGQARGIAMVVPASHGMPVSEYTPNLVKKTIVGTGHASKKQVQMMVSTLLPEFRKGSADAADALAVAICHAHHRNNVFSQKAVKSF